MTKSEAIEQIRKAKAGHKRWMSYAKAMHMGIKVDKDATPLVETDCSFGKWYYGEGQIFSEMDSYQAIEEPHEMLHQTYMKLFKTKKQPLKTGLLVSKSRALKERQNELDELMKQLTYVSQMLMENLKEFESDLKNMSDLEFRQLQ